MTTGLSAELKAMAELETALAALSDEERVRVMQWANARFRTNLRPAGSTEARGESDEQQTEDLAGFFASANPKTDAEKALVGAYWVQFREGAADVEAQAVNTKLKHLGHGIGNVTRALESLKSERPSLLVQTKKDGSTRQARKKFKVTAEGKKKVEAMVQRDE